MEALLRHYLLEHQKNDFYCYEMEAENVSEAEGVIKPPPQQRKYVSIFRIDGEPIIPPLVCI